MQQQIVEIPFVILSFLFLVYTNGRRTFLELKLQFKATAIALLL